MTGPDTGGRLAALERLTRRVAEDVEAIGYMAGVGAVPLPWYATLDYDGSQRLSEAQQEALAAWADAAAPEVAEGERWGVVEARLVTPTCGYLLMHHVTADGEYRVEWQARDDLPRWPL